jgi:malonate decarboxylase alpha subunit
MKQWNIQSEERQRRITAGSSFTSGKDIDSNRLAEFLSVVIQRGDRVCLGQQPGAGRCAGLHSLHMVQFGVVLPEHLDLFEKGVAEKLDFLLRPLGSANRAHAV